MASIESPRERKSAPEGCWLFLAHVGAIALIWMAITIPAVNGTIYLAPTSETTWSGGCDHMVCRNRATPCSWSNPILLNELVPCQVTLTNGSYSSPVSPLIISADFGVSFAFEQVSHLLLKAHVVYGQHLSLSGNLSYSKVTMTSAPSATFSISNLTLVDSTIDASTSSSPAEVITYTISNSSLIWTASLQAQTPFPIMLTNGTSLLVTDSLIESPFSVPIFYGSGSATFSFCRINTPTGLLQSHSASQYEISSSDISLVGAAPAQDDRVLFNSPFAASRVTIFNSSIKGYSSRQDRIVANSVVFDIKNSTLEGVNVFSSAKGAFANSNFTDVTLASSGTTDFENVIVTQHLPEKHVSVNASTVRMLNAAFSNPNSHPSSYLELRGGNTGIANISSSNFTVSDLRVQDGHTVLLGDAEITRTLSSDTTASIQSQTTSATWNLHSINVANVILNYTGLYHLIYTPSNASKGISYFGPPALLLPLPTHFSINWHSNILPPPVFLQPYPVATFKPGNSSILELFQPTSPYTLVASFSRTTPTLLTFQSIDNPQSPSPCSNPPPGFTCSPSGTLYAPGSVNQPSITIPSQSGNVVVIGNVTVGSGITFDGTGSTLNVIGCANIGGGITLDIDPEIVPSKGTVTLITQYDDCDTPDLNTIPLKVKLSKKSCKRVSIKADPTPSKSHLSALFVVDSSKCNVKWIILGSVLGGVLAIAVVIGFIVGSHFRAREQRENLKMASFPSGVPLEPIELSSSLGDSQAPGPVGPLQTSSSYLLP